MEDEGDERPSARREARTVHQQRVGAALPVRWLLLMLAGCPLALMHAARPPLHVYWQRLSVVCFQVQAMRFFWPPRGDDNSGGKSRSATSLQRPHCTLVGARKPPEPRNWG